MASLQQKLENQAKTQNMLAIQLGEMAEHCYAVEQDQEPKIEFPTNPVLPSERPWYEREIRLLGEEDNLDPLPVFRHPRYIYEALPESSQER